MNLVGAIYVPDTRKRGVILCLILVELGKARFSVEHKSTSSLKRLLSTEYT